MPQILFSKGYAARHQTFRTRRDEYGTRHRLRLASYQRVQFVDVQFVHIERLREGFGHIDCS
jgi:hypothetical protein